MTVNLAVCGCIELKFNWSKMFFFCLTRLINKKYWYFYAVIRCHGGVTNPLRFQSASTPFCYGVCWTERTAQIYWATSEPKCRVCSLASLSAHFFRQKTDPASRTLTSCNVRSKYTIEMKHQLIKLIGEIKKIIVFDFSAKRIYLLVSTSLNFHFINITLNNKLSFIFN